MIHYIDLNQLQSEISNCSKLMLIYFCIEDSIPCNMQNDILHNIEKEWNHFVEFFKVKISANPEAKICYDLSSFPTLIFMKENKELERQTGYADSEKIIEILSELTKNNNPE